MPKTTRLTLDVVLLSFLIFAFLTPCYTQNIIVNTQSIGVEDGLLHRDISAVFEDRDGFIWVGTIKGVQRFDGHEFKSWTAADRTGKIFHITTIGQDQAGWLWLWNNGIKEFVFLHPESGQILTEEERFSKNFPVKRGKLLKGWHSPLNQIPIDSKGQLFFASSQPNKLIVFDAVKGFNTFPLPDIKSDFVELYFIDSKDHLWISANITGSFLYQIDTSGHILNSYDYSASHDVSDFVEKNGEVYYSVADSKKIKDYKINQTGIPILVEESPYRSNNKRHSLSLTWENTRNGWSILGEDQSQPLARLNSDELPKAFSDIRSSLYEDSKGRVWFPSAWGLGLITVNPTHFQKYLSFGSETEKIIGNSARGIFVQNDTIYANFEFGGLIKIPKRQPKNWSLVDWYPNSSNYYGRPIIESEKGGFYTGQQNGQIRHIHKRLGGKDMITFLDNGAFNRFAPWSLYRDRDRLWVGTTRGLAYKDLDASHINYIDNSGFEIGSILQIYPTSNNKFWLAGSEGLCLFDPDTKSFLAKYGLNEQDPFQLPASTFYYIHIDEEKIHWLGTNKGLLRWDKNSGDYQLFSIYDGLSNDIIYTITEDDYNHLWLSSDYGIMQFNKETFEVKAYLEKDGISHQEFNRISVFQEDDGTIYLGGLNGITAFHPSDFYQQGREFNYKMFITGFEIFDGKTSGLLNKVGEICSTNTIVFHPNDRFFRLKFALLVIEDARRITYGWKVEGVDDAWNYQKENTLQIGKLPYGTHTLRVKGQSNDGRWSPNELGITVRALKPFYLQVWFILALGFVLSMSIYAYLKWRTRQYQITQKRLNSKIVDATRRIQNDKKVIEKQAEKLRQLDKIKSSFFANISHELRTPLTLILGPISSVLKSGELNPRNFTYLKSAQNSGKDLLKLVASILDLSQLDSGKLALNTRVEILFDIVRRVVAAFESHAEQSEIHLYFEYLAENSLQLEMDFDKLGVILNNLLSNALKFTKAQGKVVLKVEDQQNQILISVSDTGRGIHANDLPFIFDRFYQSNQANAPVEGGSGIGLALSKQFVKVMGGDISANSELGNGSVFTVVLPRKEVLGVVLKKPYLENNMVESTLQKADFVDRVPPNDQHSACILIVEDNHSLRNYLQLILETQYKVVSAENGVKALEFLNQSLKTDQACHLIISDIMMPEMDGYQLLEILKSHNDFRQLPVIMLTARAEMQDKLRALRIGVDDYLLKPFEEEELLVRIKNILDNQQERYAFLANEKPKKKQPAISDRDKDWLGRFEVHVQQHISDKHLSIPRLARDFAMSESSLLRQLKRLTGLSPKAYVQEVRLNKARWMLENQTANSITAVATVVGFKDSKTFSRNFKNRFGKLPSDFLIH